MGKVIRSPIRNDTDRNRLVVKNIGLVYSMVNAFFRKHPEVLGYYFREDAESDGKLGLIRASELYDPDTGFQFSTYAGWWIRQAIYRGVQNSRFVRAPRAYAVEQGRTDQFAKQRRAKVFFSPPPIFYKDSEKECAWDEADHSVNVENDVRHNELKTEIKNSLRFFDTRSQEILFRRFWENQTLKEIAEDLNLSRERIRQIQDQCLDKLREIFIQKNVRVENFI